MATKAEMIRLLRLDAKKKGQTFKECPCDYCKSESYKSYGFVERNSPRDEAPFAVNSIEEWFVLLALTEPREDVTESNKV